MTTTEIKGLRIAKNRAPQDRFGGEEELFDSLYLDR